MPVINKVVVNGTYCIFFCLILHGFCCRFRFGFSMNAAGLIIIILVSSLRAFENHRSMSNSD